MPGRLTTVVKGSFCSSTDSQLRKWVSSNDIPKLKAWLADFENLGKSLEEIGVQWDVIGAAQLPHCAEFFGNEAGCFFPNLDEALKRDVVRGAFIQALRASVYRSYESKDDNEEREEAKPIVLYWIAGGPAFEAYVSDSEKEVHVLLLTPDPVPALYPPASSRDEPIWVIAGPAYAEAIRARAKYAYEPIEPMPAGLAIECQKIKSY